MLQCKQRACARNGKSHNLKTHVFSKPVFHIELRLCAFFCALLRNEQTEVREISFQWWEASNLFVFYHS